jgi:PKD repeat protein
VSIKNYGAFVYNGTIPVYYNIGTYPAVNQTTTYASIAPGDSLLYTFTNNEAVPLSGTYTIKAGTAASPDINPANDTLSSSLIIKDLPNADAGNDQTMCLGIGAYLTATGGDSYLWSVPSPNTTQSITVTPVNTTTYYVTVTSSATGCSATDSVRVEVVSIPLPVAGFTFSAVELTVSFTNNTTGATSQYWEFGDGGYSTDTNPVHMYLLSGDYPVKLTAINICGNNVFQQFISVVGIQDYEQDENLSFFPNPARDVLNIELTTDYIRPNKIQIIDAKGQETYNIPYIITQGSIRLGVSGLPEGMYYAAIHTEEVIKLLKFLIVR